MTEGRWFQRQARATSPTAVRLLLGDRTLGWASVPPQCPGHPRQTCRASSSRGRCLLWTLWRARLCRPGSWAPVKMELYSCRRSGAGYLALENTCVHGESEHFLRGPEELQTS